MKNDNPFDEESERQLNRAQGDCPVGNKKHISKENPRSADMENASSNGPAQRLGGPRLKKKKDLSSGILSSPQIKSQIRNKTISELAETDSHSSSSPVFVLFFKIYCKEILILNSLIKPELQPLSQETSKSASIVNLEATLSQFAHSDSFDHGMFTIDFFKQICRDTELGLLFLKKKLLFQALNKHLLGEIKRVLEKHELPSSSLPNEISTQEEINTFLKELEGDVKGEIAQAIAKLIVSAQDYLKLIPADKLKPAIPKSMEWEESAQKQIDRATFLGKHCKFWDSEFEAKYGSPKKALKQAN